MSADTRPPATMVAGNSLRASGDGSDIWDSTVSRVCTQIDADVTVLRTRRLDHQPFVYFWLDATYVHVRELNWPVQDGRRAVQRLGTTHAHGYLAALGGLSRPTASPRITTRPFVRLRLETRMGAYELEPG
jgi:hypothetical protein